MPRRKRHDPSDAPIDGDYALDQVVNKQKGLTYKLLSDEDIPRFKAMGFSRVERSPDSARPLFDLGSESDPGYKVGSLTLYAAPDEIAERQNKRAEAMNEARIKQIRGQARKSGGKYESQVET
jgi:hypothetical protein